MFTFISSRLSLEAIQNGFLPTNYLSDTQWKYAKITLVVLSIFGALAALMSIYRCYQAKKLESEEKPVVPPHLSPKPPHRDPYTPTPPPKPTDKKSDLTPPSPRELDDAKLAEQLKQDAELARQLQAQYDAEETIKPIIIPPRISPTKPLDPINPPPTLPTKIDPPPIPTPVKIESPPKDPQPAKPSPFTQIDKICTEISEKIFTDSTFSAVKALSTIDPKIRQQALDLLNEIIAEFERRYPISKKIAYREQVDAYFAHVAEETSETRKYLSLVGIRNLLAVGPQIIDDFRNTLFLGGEHHYGFYQGIKAFKYYTGNLVNLDTEFVAKNDNEAKQFAREKIIEFGQRCGLKKQGLTAEVVATAFPFRKLHIDFFVPESTSNTDRSNYGLWRRGVDPVTRNPLYYVNVPNCDLVLSATLKIPYVIADLAYRTKEKHQGKLPKEFFDEFFDKGVSDKCFNDKFLIFKDFERYWTDKLNGVLSIEEETRRKIEKGDFGPVIQKKGADVALSEAHHGGSLTNFLDQFNFEYKRRPFDQWVKEDGPKIRQTLIDNGLWESALFRVTEEDDYFLLDEKTLNLFLPGYYKSLKATG